MMTDETRKGKVTLEAKRLPAEVGVVRPVTGRQEQLLVDCGVVLGCEHTLLEAPHHYKRLPHHKGQKNPFQITT